MPPFRILFSFLAAALPAAGAEPAVDFARDVYPIFQRSCFECHGAVKQKGKLRLDEREAAFKNPETIAKGHADQSELYRRIMLPKGHDDAMPNRGDPIPDAEKALVKAWINAGAPWPDGVKPAKHWAYVPPVRPAVPPVKDAGARIENAVDAFVVARLQKEGLKLSPEAGRTTLIRRLSLDLIGLPPTPQEVDAFVKDPAPNAYEKVVDRLLASDQFGVRWARPWMDYARYADSHGFQRDDLRDLWPYRDWVVKALNADMPFTQFTVEQLAGDLLPNATESQKIATGFNRSAPTNVEAGSDPEETRVNQVLDRVNTVGMIWLGSTLECCQCHDHKYDPFTQRDYYGLFAYFNNTALEADRTNPKVPGSIQFKGPTMEIADSKTQQERAEVQAKLVEAKRKLAALEKALETPPPKAVAALLAKAAQAPKEHMLEIAEFESTGGATHEVLPDQSVLISGEPAPDKDTYLVKVKTTLTDIRGLKLEALTDDSLPGKGPGRGDEKHPNFVVNNFIVTAAPLNQPDQVKPVKLVKAKADYSQPKFAVENLLKTNNTAKGGWAIGPKFYQPHWAEFETQEPVGFAEGTELSFKLQQDLGGTRTIGRLRLSAITGHVGADALPEPLVAALKTAAAQRSAEQKKAIRDYLVQNHPSHAKLEKEKTRLEAELRKTKMPTTLVMEENTPRMSSIFVRGDFRNAGDKVGPTVPVVLRSDAKAAPQNPTTGTGTRLDLAQWLVSRKNPLTARVTVNRWWAELFGHGLVTTPEDFGIKGATPTHPELLDWLACEFMDSGWSMKKTLKTLVMSATYRQSSKVTLDLVARDDQNLLYARGPRHRLEAEMIRDNALAIAGLLNTEEGGPPIKPYQPDGLWVKVGGQRYDYEPSPGAEKYRRGLYVVWKRAAPYPSFVNFDANARLACRVKRPRSNTPLQALTLMNDPVYVEAAVAFAKRVLKDKPAAADAERIVYAFRLATARAPTNGEITTLSNLLDAERAVRVADPKAAKEFLGDSELPAKTKPEELAAWYAVTAALLNLDETITKG
jgi:hypothetical protein